MKNIIIKENINPKTKDLLALYKDVEWTAYTKDPDTLNKAIHNSLQVWTAWHKDILVGLARVVGDGCTIIYIQDILILSSYQRQGIGSEFLRIILEKYKDVRQIVLLTDDTEKTVAYYKNNGLTKASEYQITAFMK